MQIRRLQKDDVQEWVRLRLALWPDSDPEEVAEELPAFLEDGDRSLLALVVERPGGKLAGLLEMSLRPMAEGCLSAPVAYVENWYVDPDSRQQGLSRAMLEEAARWARYRGCAEIASSCVMENDTAIQVHNALGFEEVDRLVHFVYELPAEG